VIGNKTGKLHTPFKVFESILRVILAVCRCMSDADKEDNLLESSGLFVSYVESLELAFDCHLFDISSFSSCLEVYELIISEIKNLQGVLQEPEKLALTVAIKYLTLGNLEKQMTAVSFLSKQIDQWKLKSSDHRLIIAGEIFHKKLLSLVFDECFHEELAKKAKDLVEFVIPFMRDRTIIDMLHEAAMNHRNEKISILFGCLASKELSENIDVLFVQTAMRAADHLSGRSSRTQPDT